MFLLLLALLLAPATAFRYNATLSERNLLLAYASYCGPHLSAAWDCYWCRAMPDFAFVSTFGDAAGADFGYTGVALGGDAVQIIMRGTDNIPGWLDDFTVKLVPAPFLNNSTLLVHAGFLKSYTAMRASIGVALRAAFARCPGCRLEIVGHSLGAALATLAATDRTTLAPFAPLNRTSLFVYGAPRAGNAPFAAHVGELFGERAVRVTWHRDIVPHVPLVSMHFRHIAREVFYEKGVSQPRICDGSGEDPLCSDQYKLFLSIEDHGMYYNHSIFKGIPHGCLFTDTKRR